MLRVSVYLVLAGSISLGLAPALAPENVHTRDMDRSVKPGDDFYRYANGAWLRTATIPKGASTYDTRAMLNAEVGAHVRELIHEAASGHAAKGSVAQKVGDYYASFMDQEAIEGKGWSPLAADMAAISNIADRAALSAYLGSTLNSEVDGLTANADHVFGLWINQGFEDAEHNFSHIWQGGLGLPDREMYLDRSAKAADVRSHYTAHIAAVLQHAGIGDTERRAQRVLALEIQIARAHAPDADAADVHKQNNPWKRAEFSLKAPGMEWGAYFRAAGLATQEDFLVWQPMAVTGTAALVASESLETWKDYLRLHLVDHYAAVLPREVAAEHFVFYGKVLGGAQQMPSRADEAVAATNGALPQAVGQLYVQRYFSPQAKARAQAMGADLLTAYRGRLASLSWMSAETKKKAQAKLAAFKLELGYPDVWINYASLEVVRGDALGNMRRAEAFNRQHNLAMLRRPVYPIDWPINPQTPGAVIMFSPNAEFFSAGILQPPYFDANGDAASNYGSAGAGMAHEITHSFDELGNIYDARGRLNGWWTEEDRARYHAAAAKLVAQFDGYCPFPDSCLNGRQIMTENIADLAGLLVAHDAYVLSLHGKPDVTIAGLSGEQRFFLAFSQRWRKLQSEAALRSQIANDTHAPGEYRSDTVRNVDEWYKAYGVMPGDKLYLTPRDRVRVW